MGGGGVGGNLEKFGPNFALHSVTTQDMCLQNIIGISLKLRVLGLLQTYQTHIGPTLHVGSNNCAQQIWREVKKM